MSTVNQQPLLDPLSLSDLILCWSAANSDTRRSSLTALLALIQANIVFPVTPVSPGSVIFMPFVGGVNNLIVSPAGGVVLPAAPTFGQTIEFIATGNNTGPMTVTVGAQPVKALQYKGAALTGGEVASGGSTFAIYDGVAYQLVSSAAIATQPKTTAPRLLENVGFTATMAGNAVTLALTAADLTAPAAGNIVGISFRNTPASSGGSTKAQVIAPVSTVLNNGSSGGTNNAVLGRVWVAAILNGAAVELAWRVNRSGVQVLTFDESGLISTTAEGGGTATSAGVWYSTTARAGVPFVVLGYFESTQAAAGVWATAASLIMVNPTIRPGQTVQQPYNVDGAYASGSTAIPLDDTIPQITEGTQFMTQAITPVSSGNILEIEHVGNYVTGTGASLNVAMFQDATANALGVWGGDGANALFLEAIPCRHRMVAGTTISTTFRMRAGTNSGVLSEFNGRSGARLMGGALSSSMKITEIFV